MLHGTVTFVVLVAFAVAGSELRAALARRGLRAPAMEGLSFLVLGAVLGQEGLGLFPEDVLATLRLVVLLGLAWIGLVFGLQIEWRVIRQLRPWHRLLGWVVPSCFGAVVLGGGLGLGIPGPLSLGLAAVAMAGSPATLEAVARGRRPVDRSVLRLVKLVTAYSGLPAVAVFAVSAAEASPVVLGGALPGWELLFFMVGVGVLVGYLSLALVKGLTDNIRILTMLAGTMSGLAGACALLGASGLPAAALTGAVLINRSTFPHRMLRVAHSLERPLLVALLVLVGASWQGGAFSWPVFVLMAGGRLLGATLGGGLLSFAARRRTLVFEGRGVGLGLLPQGELALGLVVALVSFVPGTDGVLEAVVAAVVLHQLIGQWWLRRRLLRPPDGSPW